MDNFGIENFHGSALLGQLLADPMGTDKNWSEI
jgi:hypothetical protein